MLWMNVNGRWSIVMERAKGMERLGLLPELACSGDRMIHGQCSIPLLIMCSRKIVTLPSGALVIKQIIVLN